MNRVPSSFASGEETWIRHLGDVALAQPAHRVRPDGAIALVFRNGDSLAMRPALRRDRAAALDALDGERYVNGLGVEARADRLDDVAGTPLLHVVGRRVRSFLAPGTDGSIVVP